MRAAGRAGYPPRPGCAGLLVVQGSAQELPALGGGGQSGMGVAQGVDHDEVVDDALVADGGDGDAGLPELGRVGLALVAQDV